jgi:hypothetical protein
LAAEEASNKKKVKSFNLKFDHEITVKKKLPNVASDN